MFQFSILQRTLSAWPTITSGHLKSLEITLPAKDPSNHCRRAHFSAAFKQHTVSISHISVAHLLVFQKNHAFMQPKPEMWLCVQTFSLLLESQTYSCKRICNRAFLHPPEIRHCQVKGNALTYLCFLSLFLPSLLS